MKNLKKVLNIKTKAERIADKDTGEFQNIVNKLVEENNFELLKSVVKALKEKIADENIDMLDRVIYKAKLKILEAAVVIYEGKLNLEAYKAEMAMEDNNSFGL